MGRYNNNNTVVNELDQYRALLNKRGVSSIEHYRTVIMRHPTVEEMRDLEYIDHTWKVGDRYWKLAEKHYGRAELWWVIAWFNRAPLEADLEHGIVIQIPLPLERVLVYLGK